MSLISNPDLFSYNDTPVIEEGTWKLLAPTKWGVKWKHLSEAPIVVHDCPEDQRGELEVHPDNMKDAPHCGWCKEEVPESIQAVWQMTHMEAMLG
jgi:hypothetical protein